MPNDQQAIPPKTTAVDNTQQRTTARSLYWQGWKVSAIARFLELPRTTVHTWKQTQGWDNASPSQRVEGALEARTCKILGKDNKSNSDYKELDALGRMLERLARVNRYTSSGKEADLSPDIAKRNVAPHRVVKRKNWFSERQIDLIRKQFLDEQFDYQKRWHQVINMRTRAILKSRQIGATYYFGREALLDSIDTGRNQIFISASKSQAKVFQQYIVNLAFNAAEAKLTGEDCIVLGNGAELRFLGTNFRTAQGYHGNIYVDEFMWINQFEKLNRVVRGMATHKQYRRTYATTPSVKSHEAYPFWTGETYNKHRKKEERVEINLSDAALRAGVLCADKMWRNKVTIFDAQAGGCDLFDIDELRAENSPDEFANLYECEFIDDSNSVFSFAQLQACMVDMDVAWDDYRPYTERPFAGKPVWIGHDAGLSGDGSALVVVAPPDTPGGKFRILHTLKFKGANYETQAQAIQRLTYRFNVEHIAIDITGGYGSAVHELVVKFFPAAKALNYNLELKERMVLKARAVINKSRLEMDTSETDLVRAFLSIKRTLTKSQKAITYETGRSEQTGHGELAWAAMNVLINEPLDEATISGKTSSVEIF